jgi:hypothetical protein
VTAENVFRFSRAYQLYYQGRFDFQKYKGRFPAPPLIKQKDRRFYHKIAQQLADPEVHALFTIGYFYDPKIYIATLTQREWTQSAVAFAARWQNGRPFYEAELYNLAKQMEDRDVIKWLYEPAIPECMQEAFGGEMALDTACMIMLIPQKQLGYNWAAYWSNQKDGGLGVTPLLERLKKADQLLYAQRPGWRVLSHSLMEYFWKEINKTSLTPPQETSSELFA